MGLGGVDGVEVFWEKRQDQVSKEAGEAMEGVGLT